MEQLLSSAISMLSISPMTRLVTVILPPLFASVVEERVPSP